MCQEGRKDTGDVFRLAAVYVNSDWTSLGSLSHSSVATERLSKEQSGS